MMMIIIKRITQVHKINLKKRKGTINKMAEGIKGKNKIN